MIRRLLPMLLAVLMVVVSFGSAQQPGEPGDGPLRLKKKKRAGDVPAPKEPGKEEEGKPKEKAPPGKEKAKEEDDLPEPEDGRPDTEEDEKVVLERIGKNMRGVEEKLGNRELGDPTRQQMRDVIRDLDSLIKKQQQSQNNEDQQGGGGSQQQDKDKSSEKQQQSRSKQGSSSQRSSSRSKQRQQRRQRGQRSGRDRSGSGQPKSQPGGEQSQPKPQAGNSGSNPGAGSKSPENKKDMNADLYKDVWGHLPESLRAGMNAYSNPAPFMPRYDDLIKKYYRTIAEQGRKKGD
jgi:hypothetical protein